MKKVVKNPAKDIKGAQSVQTKQTSKVETNIFRVNSMASRSNNSYARQHSESLTRKNSQTQKPVPSQRDHSTKVVVKAKVEIVNKRSSTVSSHRNSYSSLASNNNKRKQEGLTLETANFKRMKTESLVAMNKGVNKGQVKVTSKVTEKIKIDLSKSTILPRKGTFLIEC